MQASPTVTRSIRSTSAIAIEVGVRRASMERPIRLTNEATGESIIVHTTLPSDVSGMQAWKASLATEHNIAIGDLTWANA